MYAHLKNPTILKGFTQMATIYEIFQKTKSNVIFPSSEGRKEWPQAWGKGFPKLFLMYGMFNVIITQSGEK